MTEDTDRIVVLEERVNQLERELARYRGFAGGIVFVLVGVWSVIEVILPFLKTKTGG